jgi:AbrB family looped-hinge helix DNA binding protein
MKVGERGQVTIPKGIRDRFGIAPGSQVEFRVVHGSLVLRKAPRKLNLDRWNGRCGESLSELGLTSVEAFLEDIRGR